MPYTPFLDAAVAVEVSFLLVRREKQKWYKGNRKERDVYLGHSNTSEKVTVHWLDDNSMDSKARHSLDSKISNFTHDIAWTT
jgi:hypothetical protein